MIIPKLSKHTAISINVVEEKQKAYKPRPQGSMGFLQQFVC